MTYPVLKLYLTFLPRPLYISTSAKAAFAADAGAKRLVPEAWRKWPLFDNIFRLTGVPVITVQLRYNGWVTELQDPAKVKDLAKVLCCWAYGLVLDAVPSHCIRNAFGITTAE